MSLRWNQIDIKRNRITLHETKNDERRAVALVGHACEQIKELARQAEPQGCPSHLSGALRL